MITVEQPGLLTSLQDTGRPGYANAGIGRSGAADLPAMYLANSLVGNRFNACVLEMTLSGPGLVFAEDSVIALTGAPLPGACLDGEPLTMWQTQEVKAGSRLITGAMPMGCRSYLAVAGGFDSTPWCGSCSTDINAGLGPVPAPLKQGDCLSIGKTEWRTNGQHRGWSLDPRPWFPWYRPPVIHLLPGSHRKGLTAEAADQLFTDVFRIGHDSNRVGWRLDVKTPLALQKPLELISEGIVPGVVQLPPNGRPIIMGPEHPVTGGYPRIGQVAAVDLPVLAQCQPGDEIRFEETDYAQARKMFDERDNALTALIEQIRERLEPS